MLQIMLGNANILSTATFHWIELYIAHFLYIRPFTMVSPYLYLVFCQSLIYKVSLIKKKVGKMIENNTNFYEKLKKEMSDLVKY